jgi:hypothetical protein
MGTPLGFYFAGLTQEEVNQVRAQLNRIAAEFGYVAKAGPTAGQGNAAALLVAIARGKIKLVKVEQGVKG